MSCFAAARCVARSAGRTSSAARIAGKSKPSSSSTFSVPKTLISRPTSFRSAMESSRCLNSMLPFHSATASSLLISMLSVSNPIYAWTVEEHDTSQCIEKPPKAINLSELEMSCLAAARSVARSAGRTSSAARLAGRSKPSSSSTFSVPKTLISRPTSFRSAMETSRCLNSMLPFHSATASSLLNSMLSISNPIYSWNIEDC